MKRVKENRYEPILNPESSEFKKLIEKEAKFIAFNLHLAELGRNQDREPRLHKGKTEISIPAFFRLPEYQGNDLNAAALELLPKFSYSPGYGDTTNTHVDNSGLRNLFNKSDELNSARAAREGRLLQSYMRDQLSLGVESSTCFWSMQNSSTMTTDHRYYRTSDLLRGITKDLDEKIVSDIKDVAELVNQRGYEDFFDYLLDIKQVTDERVETIFSHPANGTVEQLTIE